jgi:hypothetical protein
MIAAMAERLKNFTTKLLLGNPTWIYATWLGVSHRVVITEKEQAIKDTNLTARAGNTSLYPEASVTARLAAVAIARSDKEGATVVLQESIGWASTL